MQRPNAFLNFLCTVFILYIIFRYWSQSGESEIDGISIDSSSLLEASLSVHPTHNQSHVSTHPFWRPFPLTLVPKVVCPDSIKTIFVTYSATSNSKRRAAIRRTYGDKKWKQKLNYQTMFVVGKSENEEENRALDSESIEFGDLLQADFLDSYRNLTIKGVTWMRFLRDNCPHTTMVLLLNDDILPNIFWIFTDLAKGRISTNRTFTCVSTIGKPNRNEKSPYQPNVKSAYFGYISREAHPADHWAPFCSGSAYFMSADLLADTVNRLEMREHYAFPDDVFITGEIAKTIGAHHNFQLYDQNCGWNTGRQKNNERDLERRMIAGELIFGKYQSYAQMERIFDELTILSGHVTDPPDDLRESRKDGPTRNELSQS